MTNGLDAPSNPGQRPIGDRLPPATDPETGHTAHPSQTPTGPGGPPPSPPYPGELWAKQQRHPDGSVTVEILRADPRIAVSGSFMDEIRSGDCLAIKSTVHGNTELLTITASNGQWVYVVGQYDSGRDVYHCHWPD